MSEDSTYQGYANYETFSVDLMLNNDKEWGEVATAIVRTSGRSLEADQALQEFVEGLAGVTDGDQNLMRLQLVNCAISAVDWRELVNTIADRIEEG